MQEQNSEKVVSLSVRTTKVTANVLKSAVRAYLSAQKNKSPKVYKGKQSVKHLIQKGEKLTNIEVTDQNIKSFNKTARKYGIDYSLKKDGSEKPPRYFIFFKAKDAEVMNAAFKDFLGSEMRKSKKPSIKARLKTLGEQVKEKAQERTREKNKTREAEL